MGRITQPRRNIEEEVNKAFEWIENGPPDKIKTKREREILHHAYILLNYRAIYPGLTREERTSMKRIKILQEDYDRRKIERMRKRLWRAEGNLY